MSPAKITQKSASWLKRFVRFRAAATILILVLTVVIFVRFFVVHPEYIQALKQVSVAAVLAILGLNALLVIVLAIIYQLTLKLAGGKIPFKEQLLLTSYSSIANFFGPLQSGPAVRTVYLKGRHQISMGAYLLATVVNYALFALVNVFFLFVGNQPWWRTLLALLAAAACCFVLIKLVERRQARRASPARLSLSAGVLGFMLLAVFVQCSIVAAYYFVELRAVGVRPSLSQLMAYTGAANLALFVAITPDAIGFRESFLRFSQHLHHISTGIIFSANLLDRAVYAFFLILLFVIVLAFHGQRKLKTMTQAHSAKPTVDD